MIALYRSFSSLGRTERWRVVEAATLIPIVWCGLRILRFAALQRMLDRGASVLAAAPRVTARHTIAHSVQRAVNRAAARVPGGRNCLVQALVAHTMLRRHGIPSELRIGVRRTGASLLEAHAWIECDGDILVGGIDGLSDFSRLGA
jgi:hypothetical protein